MIKLDKGLLESFLERDLTHEQLIAVNSPSVFAEKLRVDFKYALPKEDVLLPFSSVFHPCRHTGKRYRVLLAMNNKFIDPNYDNKVFSEAAVSFQKLTKGVPSSMRMSSNGFYLTESFLFPNRQLDKRELERHLRIYDKNFSDVRLAELHSALR